MARTAEAAFRRELAPWTLLGLTLGLVEGATAAVLIKKTFADAADPWLVNLAVAFVSGAPALSNVVSFVWANLALLATLFVVKLVTKGVGVYPPAIRYLPAREAMFTTLLMSTGLTFGTISSLYGLRTGIFDRAQFSVIVTVQGLVLTQPEVRSVITREYVPAPTVMQRVVWPLVQAYE